MIYAYDKIYLNRVQFVMASMFDYATHELGYRIQEFWTSFVNSPVAKRIETGDSSTIAGHSGVELALEVVSTHDELECFPEQIPREERSHEYWLGWAVAYYQWMTGASFQRIGSEVTVDILIELYHPYHEMDITQFVDKVNEIRASQRLRTYLQYYRKLCGLTQSELAEITEIPLKTIQKYESREKNINKASAENIIKLSRALNCNPADIMEL